ncbi:MAG: hypothetical protein KJ561_00425 [Nanoarchaeota archaeon]|nr:hypothetical protein [Nanoarchaeota archaeon]
MEKKGQGLPLNVIIIAAIVLIVLVVLWAIFTGRMGVFSKGLTDVTKGGTCAEAGGVVKTQVDGCASGCTPVYTQLSDVSTGETCCKPSKGCLPGTYTEVGSSTPKKCEDITSEPTCTSKGCTWGPYDKSIC